MNVTIEFRGRETLKKAYEIHIESLNQAIAICSTDPELMREIELDLQDKLAQIKKFQAQSLVSQVLEK